MTRAMVAETDRDFASAELHFADALAQARALGMEAEETEVLVRMARNAHELGREDDARTRLKEARSHGLIEQRYDLLERAEALEREMPPTVPPRVKSPAPVERAMPEDAGERSRVASDGSPYPDRTRPTFEHDVQAMFGYIAERYDWFDHVASLGNDFLWRPRALGQLDRFRSPDRSSAPSTSDAAPATSRARSLDGTPGPTSWGRISPGRCWRMRSGGTDVASEGSRVALARATALHLPFADGAFDLVTNAFVARNLSDLGQAFREMRRVLRPGGTLLTLEITEPTSPTFGALFHAYFDRVVPWMGAAVASAGPYRYLPESLRTLPGRDALLGLMHVAGFPRAVPRPQSFGIVTTFLAEAGSSPHPSA